MDENNKGIQSWFTPETKAHHSCFLVLIIFIVIIYSIVTLVGGIF